MKEKQLLHALGSIDDHYIEQLYLSERKNTKESVKPGSLRRWGRILLLAAAISLLGMAAYASAVPQSAENWFSAFFENDATHNIASELTSNQSEILYEGLAQINQRMTVNGYTITLESGLCDGYRALIKCRIEAPEGDVLDADKYGLGYSSIMDASSEETWDFFAKSFHSFQLEDENASDNAVTFLLELLVQPSVGSEFTLANGSVWSITIENITEQTGSGEDAQWRTLCDGPWEFELAFEENLLVTQSAELLTEPIRIDSTMFINNTLIRSKRLPMKTKVFSFEIRTLTATIRNYRPFIAKFEGVDLKGPIYLVMKDGSRVEVKMQQTIYRGDHDETLCTFDRPVSAEEVAYIEFPGAERIVVAGTNNP